MRYYADFTNCGVNLHDSFNDSLVFSGTIQEAKNWLDYQDCMKSGDGFDGLEIIAFVFTSLMLLLFIF